MYKYWRLTWEFNHSNCYLSNRPTTLLQNNRSGVSRRTATRAPGAETSDLPHDANRHAKQLFTHIQRQHQGILYLLLFVTIYYVLKYHHDLHLHNAFNYYFELPIVINAIIVYFWKISSVSVHKCWDIYNDCLSWLVYRLQYRAERVAVSTFSIRSYQFYIISIIVWF